MQGRAGPLGGGFAGKGTPGGNITLLGGFAGAGDGPLGDRVWGGVRYMASDEPPLEACEPSEGDLTSGLAPQWIAPTGSPPEPLSSCSCKLTRSPRSPKSTSDSSSGSGFTGSG